MSTIQSEIMINGDKHSLFKMSQDYNLRLMWDPFLKEARLLEAMNEVKIGVRAWCVSKFGIGMETKYVFVREPDVVAIEMTKGPLILKHFAGSWRFIQINERTIKVVFRYYFRSRLILLEPMLQILFKREMKKRLISLKTYFEENQ